MGLNGFCFLRGGGFYVQTHTVGGRILDVDCYVPASELERCWKASWVCMGGHGYLVGHVHA